MTISWSSMARKVAFLETEAAIENKDDAKVIARAMHTTAQGELKLRDAEKKRAHDMQNVANTVQCVQAAVTTAQKVQDLGTKVQDAGAAESSPDGAEATKERTPEETKAAKKEEVREKIRDHIQSQVLEDVQKVAMEKLEYAERTAQERAGRHEELAGEYRALKSQIRSDAYAHLAEVAEIEKEGFDRQYDD